MPPRSNSSKLFERFADRYRIDPAAILGILRDTVFTVPKGEAPFSPEELAAALILAEQYDLNPFAREIYLTRSRGKLLPIVPIDGWSTIVNRHPAHNGVSFAYDHNEQGELVSVTCEIYRRDRQHPISVPEYLAECYRKTEPWDRWPRRMLRHKAFIQCARLAYALSGIYDEDEAERIRDADVAELPAPRPRRELPAPRPWTAWQPQEQTPEPATPPERQPGEDEPPAEEAPAPEPPSLDDEARHAELWQAWEEWRERLSSRQLLQVKRAAGVNAIAPALSSDDLERVLEHAQAVFTNQTAERT